MAIHKSSKIKKDAPHHGKSTWTVPSEAQAKEGKITDRQPKRLTMGLIFTSTVCQ
jgi:hypothetical protein